MSKAEEVAISQNLSAQEALRSLRQQLINHVMRITMIASAFALLISGYNAYLRQQFNLILIYVGAYGVLLFVTLWKRAPYGLRAGVVAALFYVMGIVDLVAFGWEMDSRIFMLAFPVMITLFWGRREGVIALILSAISLVGVGAAILSTATGDLLALFGRGVDWVYLLSNSVAFLFVGTLLVVVLGMLISLLSSELERVLGLSETLSQQQLDLDKRAKTLQEVNYAMQRRTMQLEAGAEVGRAIVSIFDLEQLLTRAVHLVTESFGFYHTGIFLINEDGEWAVLKAVSSEGGQQMLTQGHRLRRGEGMVGWVLEHREPRIALDVGEDAVHFANPVLPLTRSEVALPLLVGRRIIGVLNVQSTEEAAFDQDDVRALEFLAGQLAVAIENARRLSKESSLLEATSPFYRMARHVATARTSQELYTAIIETVLDYNPTQAFVFLSDRDQRAVHLIAELRGSEIAFPDPGVSHTELLGEESLVTLAFKLTQPLFVDDLRALGIDFLDPYRESLESLRVRSGARSIAFIPIQMGGNFMGLLAVSYHTLHTFTASEQQLYRALADMAGVAMERTLLVEQSQDRVLRERWMRDFAEQMLGTLDLREMMAQAATSLKAFMKADGVVVAFEKSVESGLEGEDA